MNDYSFVKDLFALLDTKLDTLVADIKACDDPDGMGLLDDAEYVLGMGFVAAQRFLTSAYGWHDIPKNTAISAGPRHKGGQSYAKIVNAAANYWKHVEEWQLHAVVHRDKEQLQSFQSDTMAVIESVTPWADYTLANLLHELIGEPKLSLLLPILEQWDRELVAAHT